MLLKGKPFLYIITPAVFPVKVLSVIVERKKNYVKCACSVLSQVNELTKVHGSMQIILTLAP